MDVRLHEHESDRLLSLRSYGLLDAGPLPELDAVTRLAAAVCSAPRAELNLVEADVQYTVSSVGGGREGGGARLARSESVCSDVVASDAPLVLHDLRWLDRYSGLAEVGSEPGLRAYAGTPLTGRDGLPLGALCVCDDRPRVFPADQLAGLTDLARQAAVVLELHRRDTADGLGSPRLVPEVHDPAELHRAAMAEQFVPHFQPVVDLASGRLHSFEALMRWEHPRRGVLTPDRFLPGLETGQLIRWAGRVVLDRVCQLLVRLRDHGLDVPGGVSVNVGSHQLSTAGLARRILDRLAEDDLPGGSLTVELTETADTADSALARRETEALRAAGVRVVADDFGVGWSNLTRLLDLPISGIKIDRHLVGGIAGDRERRAVVSSALGLAARLGLETVAEGVETEAELHTLRELGCERGQGWLFGRPVPAAEVVAVLSGRRPT